MIMGDRVELQIIFLLIIFSARLLLFYSRVNYVLILEVFSRRQMLGGEFLLFSRSISCFCLDQDLTILLEDIFIA